MSTPLVVSVTDELVAELEAMASKATPGSWTTDGAAWVVAKNSDQLNGGYGLAFCEGPDELKNAKYMAKASPLVIRALIAERAELKRDAERYRWIFDHCEISSDEHGIFEDEKSLDAAMQSEAKP